MALLLLLVAGCSVSGSLVIPEDTGVADTGDDPVVDTDTGPRDTDGACGEVSTWDLTLRGVVVDLDGDPVGGADVQLEDRAWNDGDVLGSGTTNNAGRFEIGIDGLTSVEDCWGSLLDYVIMGERGSLEGEKGINPFLLNAITDGSLIADISQVPLVLEPPG